MPIDTAALSSLANAYAKRMTSIRGRRVQRLLRREFAGADWVFVVQAGIGRAAVVGLSASGAAFCCTDGRGKEAIVLKWLHGSTDALESVFDLLRDSLPELRTARVPLEDPVRDALRRVSQSAVTLQARPLIAKAMQALDFDAR